MKLLFAPVVVAALGALVKSEIVKWKRVRAGAELTADWGAKDARGSAPMWPAAHPLPSG